MGITGHDFEIECGVLLERSNAGKVVNNSMSLQVKL